MNRILFKNATLIDGSGAPAWKGDLAIACDSIAGLEPGLDLPEAETIDAEGLILAPGFIDIHGHSDMTLFRWPFLESKLFQGVTTEVVGNCGLGLFPAAGKEELAEYLGVHDFQLPSEGITWSDFGGFATRAAEAAPALNLAPLVGHGALRMAVMGMESRPADEAETARMRGLLDAALEQGAWGFSTGLIYPPGSYAGTEEIVALAMTAASRGALYASHIRGEGEQVEASLREAIEIGRRAGVRVQVSHLKAMGRWNKGRASDLLKILEEARSSGVDVVADQYPYAASATTLAAVVPAWAHEGGRLLERLGDPLLRERLVAEIDGAIAAREGAQGIVVTGCASPGNRPVCGETLAAVAASRGCSPAEAAVGLLLEEQGRVGAIFFSMAEEDVETILRDPMVAVGSDGHGMNLEDAAGEATHPRSYGTFPRVLGRYVREKGLLPLETAVWKMTGLPASRLGFTRRGLLRAGYAADLVLFDPKRIAESASYADPHRYGTGIEYLLVNGVPVIRKGELTGDRPGRVLRRGEE